MPRVQLTAGAYRENGSVDRFDQVKLDRGEARRLWVVNEGLAWMEYRHNIKAPVFQEDGSPLTTERKVRGSMRTVFDMENGYIGGPICLGNPEVLQTQELDPDGCPACAGVARMLKDGIGDARDLRPQPRYALPVIQYEMLSKSDVDKGLRNPPNAKVLVWALSQWSWEQVDGIRGQMADILGKDSPEEVQLQMCDICVANENGYQKIDKIWPKQRAWAHNSDAGRALKAVVQGLWGNEENRPTDEQLKAACGRTSDWGFMDQDIRDAEERWHKAVNHGKAGPAGGTGGNFLADGQQAASLDEGLDLLSDVPPPPEEDLRAGHPGGLDEFATPERKAELAAAADDGDLFGGAAEPAPASPVSDDGDLFGGSPVLAGTAPANGSGKRGDLASFTDIIDGAGAGQ